MPTLAELSSYMDDMLRTSETPDYPPALNGVQVHTEVEITRIAAAVDAREKTILAAVESGAQLLLVHHGLFWGGIQPLVGPQLRRVRALMGSRLGLYASHLPLDAHPEIGNGVLLARELGLIPTGTFARFTTIEVGVTGETDITTSDLIAKARAFATEWDGQAVAPPVDADRRTRRWGVCTGAGASTDTLREASSLGIDTLIVGEGPHHTAVESDEMGIVVIYAGHYATETLGIRALAERVSRTFDVPWVWLHAPTGL